MLVKRGERVCAAVRCQGSPPASVSSEVVVGDLTELANFQDVLKGVDCIVHLVGRAHVMHDQERDPEQAYFKVNAGLTSHLALHAASLGVKRFIYLSSIKVNGEETTGEAFCETDLPFPIDAYGRSKLAAEQALWKVVSARTSSPAMEVVVIRSPLVYGPGVKGNILRLIDWVARGVPIPLGAANNLRSLVGVNNLCDFVASCVNHPGAADETFLISDQQDLSVANLVRSIADALNRKPRLINIPPNILRFAGGLIGREAEVGRLVGSLQVDSTKATRLLDWRPVVPVVEELERMVSWYQDNLRYRRH
jgi:nucleoside-diphosphate-sugar epimerase